MYTVAERVANSVDSDQTPRSAASDLGLHSLSRPVCPATYSKYGNLTKSQSLRKHFGFSPDKTHFQFDQQWSVTRR